jgi:phospholipase/carboxylesterase
MAKRIFNGIELLPDNGPVKQLFILLHGVGENSSDLLTLANKFRKVFPDAGFLLPDGFYPFDGGNSLGDSDYRRQWFSISGVTEETRPARVAESMPALHALVRQAQDHFKVLQTDTALIGFSQGAIMALEYSIVHDGSVGRVLAFSGRFATLPEKAPELTTLHLLHGTEDQVIQVEHVYDAYSRITELQGDATIDVASSVGHEIHDALSDRAITRLQTCIPLRSWKQALTASN